MRGASDTYAASSKTKLLVFAADRIGEGLRRHRIDDDVEERVIVDDELLSCGERCSQLQRSDARHDAVRMIDFRCADLHLAGIHYGCTRNRAARIERVSRQNQSAVRLDDRLVLVTRLPGVQLHESIRPREVVQDLSRVRREDDAEHLPADERVRPAHRAELFEDVQLRRFDAAR
jgi:hypothetical protein